MAYEFLDEATQAQQMPQKPVSGLSKANSMAKEALRHPTRIASRVGESIVGLPGDIASLLNIPSQAIYEGVSGKKGVPYEETYLGKILPTTAQHRSAMEEGTKGYLKPQNKVEKFIDDSFQDATNLIIPSKAAPTAVKGIKALATALGANLAGETTKAWTGNETAGTGTKLGAFFLMGLMNKGNAARYIGNKYQSAEKALSENSILNASPEAMKLVSLKNDVLAGRSYESLAPSEQFVVKEVDHILDLIKDGKANVRSFWAAKRSLNEKLQEFLFKPGTKETKKGARALASRIVGIVKGALTRYGKKNPNFGKNFEAAEEGFGAIAQSNFMSRWIPENIRYSPVTHGLIHLISPLTSGISQAVIPYHMAKIGYRMIKSPTLRKYYTDTAKAASKENAVLFNRNLQKLDKQIQKEEKKDRYEFID